MSDVLLDLQAFGTIGIKTMDAAGRAHRRVIEPGRWVDGAFVPTNLDNETPEIVRFAQDAWTPEVVTAWKLILEGINKPSTSRVEDYKSAIVEHLDAVAASRRYDSALSIATYVNSNIEAWAAEAIAFVAWRDAVWAYAYLELDKVMSGQRPQPPIDEFLLELPAIEWPTAISAQG